MLTNHWTPVLPASFHGIRRELDEALNRSRGNGHQQQAAAYLPLTIWEDDQTVYLEVDLPGFSRDSLDVSFHDGQLEISGERPVPKDDGRYWHNERMIGRFSRTIALPDVVDPQNIEAEFEEGVLSLKMAKRPELQPRKISIRSARGTTRRKKVTSEKS